LGGGTGQIIGAAGDQGIEGELGIEPGLFIGRVTAARHDGRSNGFAGRQGFDIVCGDREIGNGSGDGQIDVDRSGIVLESQGFDLG